MARHGRGFPLGTQFVATPVAPLPLNTRLQGSPTFRMLSFGVVRVRIDVKGSAVFHLNTTGDIKALQKVRGLASMHLNTAGVVSILGGGGTATTFSPTFSSVAEAFAGLAVVEEFGPTHAYLQAAAQAFKTIAAQGEPATIGPTGVINTVPKFTGATQLGTSLFTDDGTEASLAGSFNLAAGKVYKVNSVQVVSSRVTGYVAMTGTPNRATVYDTASVTLAQLAGRVKALQDDLMIHGLIGT
jgi:hypothetical protein